MTARLNDARILMYSHDSFGLGHLRRCRTIAHALVEDYRGLNVLIISGATIAGAFDYRARVDFVKIPSVIKLRNGEYTSMDQHIDLQETLKMRRSIIYHTAESFQPDIFIVDKEPMGLRGEVEETLTYLKSKGTKLVIGLRDVMDAPQLLEAEWKRNDVLKKIERFYDHVWVYGPPDFHDPLTGLEVPQPVRDKMDFVGFLQRSKTQGDGPSRHEGDYILVTTGGGGDGSELIDDVIRAYKFDRSLTQKALVVLGPYMPAEQRQKFASHVADIPHMEIIEFDNRMEDLVAGAQAVVSMGGYNTVCEILSFDKPALVVPRIVPREEQLIRASRASELGLFDMLSPEEAEDPALMAQALKALLKRPPPSANGRDLKLDGLENISQRIAEWLQPDDTQKAISAIA
ncbi:glycosyltransferase family protein [uncultured Agrobacterium sp.]|uniref:glycosyltransferase family protein n=1 Tax=uncultured Agrobacterium sp. TaxID=157277 RepID=UPI00258E1648|nr:glycosyltransferase family protein [uncultured Agrobacterium sp.]